jgi:hypothetical protein
MPRKQLVLDTRDGKQLNDTQSVEWNVADALRDVQGRVNWVMVDEVEIPHLFYNINNSNNLFELDVYQNDGITFIRTDTIQLDEGYYSINEFESALASKLSALGADAYTVVNGTVNNRITVTNTSGNYLQFVYANNTIGRRIGMIEDIAPTSNSIVGQRPFDLRGITSLMVSSNIVSADAVNYSGDNGTTVPFLDEVKVSTAFGGTIFKESTSDLHKINVGSSLPDTIEMALVNRKTQPIDMNKFDWRISLLIDYD